MKKFFSKYRTTLIFLLSAIIFTILVMNIDVRPIGPQNTNVGFATLNMTIHNLTGVNNIFYKLTQCIGILIILIAATHGAIGAWQWLNRKEILKVDKEIRILGIIYIITIALYFIFTKVAVNYRPVLEDGILEPSYPSSHTVLAFCVCTCGILLNNKNFDKFKYKKLANNFLIFVMTLEVIGRLLSGYHWFTDIIGGCLIAGVIISLYKALIFEEKKKI